jgi:hypothetical protein
MSNISSSELLKTVCIINKKLALDEYKNLPFMEKYTKLCDEHEEFMMNTGPLIKIMIKNGDMAIVAMYIHYLRQVENGKITLEEVEKKMGEIMAKLFFPKNLYDEYEKTKNKN